MRRLLSGVLLAAAVGRLAAQGFRERVEVAFVRVELLATDSQGRPVQGLAQADVRVKVDGTPVAIEGFEAPLPELPRPLPEMPVGRQGLPKPPGPAAAELPSTPADTAPPRYYVAVLSDETSTEQGNRKATYAQLFEFLGKGLPADMRLQLMRFDGMLRIVCPWTSDPELLRRGAAALAERRAAARVGGPGNISESPENGPHRPDFDAMEAIGHVRTSLAGLFDAIREFPEKPGRKALYFVTDGTPFLAPSEIARDIIATSVSDATIAGGPDAERRARLETERDTGLLLDSLGWDRTRSRSLLSDITRLALLREVEIHPVRSAPHDLGSRVRTDRAFHERATVRAGRSLDPRSSRSVAEAPPTTEIAASQGMESLAEASGGESVLSRRFFQDDLKRETENRNTAYLVTFRDPHAGDHRFHSIEITVSRPGTKLRYRRGYRILDVRESLLQATVNRLHVPSDENPLGVRLQLQVLRQENGQVLAEVRAAYPAPPEAGRTSSGDAAVQLFGICGVRDGVLSQPIDLSGPAERVRFADTNWMVRAGTLRLKPGAYRWSFAIRDEQTGITSYLTFDRALP